MDPGEMLPGGRINFREPRCPFRIRAGHDHGKHVPVKDRNAAERKDASSQSVPAVAKNFPFPSVRYSRC